MNSNLQKDASINLLLTKLFDRFGENKFYLTNYWDADLCGIGFKSVYDNKNLIYVSTLNKHNDTFYIEVEKANSETDLTDYEVVERIEEINIEQLYEIVEKYLFLKPIYEQ